MLTREEITEQLGFTIASIDVPNLGQKIEGKVRDCYVQGPYRILIASDRLSAFDVVLTTIPFKGQLLSDLAAYWFAQTTHIVENHIVDRPHPNVFIGREVEIIPIEVVVRGYLAGSAWRDYKAGRDVSGIALPEGMKRGVKFDAPIITPSTKAERGTHDTPISSAEIVSSDLVSANLWAEICEKALALFSFGTAKAKEHGLILVDTKYEFGVLREAGKRDRLVLADEIHTQDSSRYWIEESYLERFSRGEDPEMLDKEFVRRWLMDRGYMGEGTPPKFPDAFRVDIALKYMDVFERLTGKKFQATVGAQTEQIIKILDSLKLPS